MPRPRALACPASLKGVLSARAAASALADGFERAGVECAQLPLADRSRLPSIQTNNKIAVFFGKISVVSVTCTNHRLDAQAVTAGK